MTEKSRKLETLNAQLLAQLDDKSKTMNEITKQLTDSINLLSQKDTHNKKLVATMAEYDKEMEFLRSENEKSQLALDLAKANLARQQAHPEDDDELGDLKDKMARKDEVIEELKAELEQRNDDFNKLELQVEQLGELFGKLPNPDTFEAAKMSDSNKETETEIRDQIDKLVARVHELETENLTLKEENIELMENAEEAVNPQKYQMIEG